MKKITNVEYVCFDLAHVMDADLEGADVIVHCAYQTSVASEETVEGRNADIIAAERLVQHAQAKNQRIIFLSSFSACKDAKSYYGKNKYRVQNFFESKGAVVLRLGIVVGGVIGLFGKLKSSIRKSPIIPLLDGGNQCLQVVALDDVCRIIERCVEDSMVGVFDIAHPHVMTLRQLAQGIQCQLKVRRLYLSLPSWFAYYAVRVVEVLRIPLTFSSQNILGIYDLRTSTRIRVPEIFGIRLRSYSEMFEVI